MTGAEKRGRGQPLIALPFDVEAIQWIAGGPCVYNQQMEKQSVDCPLHARTSSVFRMFIDQFQVRVDTEVLMGLKKIVSKTPTCA